MNSLVSDFLYAWLLGMAVLWVIVLLWKPVRRWFIKRRNHRLLDSRGTRTYIKPYRFKVTTAYLDDSRLDLGVGTGYHNYYYDNLEGALQFLPSDFKSWDTGSHLWGGASNFLYDIYISEWDKTCIVAIQAVNRYSGKVLDKWPDEMLEVLKQK